MPVHPLRQRAAGGTLLSSVPQRSASIFHGFAWVARVEWGFPGGRLPVEQTQGVCRKAVSEEDPLKTAAVGRNRLGLSFSIFFAACLLVAAMPPQLTSSDPAAAPVPYNKPFTKLWHSETTKHDFAVQVNSDVFRADWVNVPPDAAKQGASIHTECRRSGAKWVGTSNIKMLVAVPGAPAGKDTKLCSMTVRFEVDTLTSLKISGHSESLQNFDAKTCQVQKTGWSAFTWVPKP
jgi:hypothetical protein